MLEQMKGNYLFPEEIEEMIMKLPYVSECMMFTREKHNELVLWCEIVYEPALLEEESITREQLAAILYRFAQHMGYDTEGQADLSGFTDLAQVSTYAREAMAWAVSAGLLQGRSDGTLDPSGSATRAQTAVILQRLETLLEKN